MPRTSPRRRIATTYRLALAALLLAAFFLRVYHLSSAPPGLHFDEAVYGLQALDMYLMALLFAGVGVGDPPHVGFHWRRHDGAAAASAASDEGYLLGSIEISPRD